MTGDGGVCFPAMNDALELQQALRIAAENLDLVVARDRRRLQPTGTHALHKTDLDTIMHATGVSANVCVESTMREGFINNHYVVLVRDGTAVYSHKEHDMTVCNTDRFFGEVSTIEELRDIWSGRNA